MQLRAIEAAEGRSRKQKFEEDRPGSQPIR